MKNRHARVQRQRRGSAAGFTLVQLMIAVAIVAILTAMAYPTYLDQLRRGNRAEVKGALMEDAQFLERNYTVNNCYHRIDAACTTTAGNVDLPRTQSPPQPGTAKYTITVAYSTTSPCTLGQCFTLSATPTGTMAGDSCGTFTLTQAGAQGATGATGATACWQK